MDTKFGKILENAVRLAGRDVSLVSIPEDWKVLASMTVNEGIRRITADKFPFMTRVEVRRYRPEYESNQGWRKGMQCYYRGEYWELIEESSTDKPGAHPCWKQLDMKEVPAFIAFEQPWENTVIDRGGIDVNRFAYVQDPKLYPHATPIKTVGMNELGIELQAPAPKEVFAKFVPEFPRIEFIEWDGKEQYPIGSVVYLTATKDCYQATTDVEAGGSSPVSDKAGNWRVIRIRDEFESFLTRLVASDLMTEDQGKYQTRAAADSEFDALCERFHEGNGESRARRGRFR